MSVRRRESGYRARRHTAGTASRSLLKRPAWKDKQFSNALTALRTERASPSERGRLSPRGGFFF